MIIPKSCECIGAGLILALAAISGWANPRPETAADSRWLETRSAHFQVFGCGSTQEVARLAARLEQFHQAYSRLAGAQAVASPPVVVMGFSDQQAMDPFLPLQQGAPANLGGFFKRDSDENLIVLPLAGAKDQTLEVVFHEYAHLLFRRNGRIWPLWLMEGMADVYSTLEVAGDRTVRIGRQKERYLNFLRQTPMMPLVQLFAVDQESPAYLQSDRQRLFYSQSWLLTHYLILGNEAHKRRFGQLTVLLAAGQSPVQAFTNAFQLPLAAMQRELQAYASRTALPSIALPVDEDLRRPRVVRHRRPSPAEVQFRLGNLLMRVDRFADAEQWFLKSREADPGGPFGFEGLGLLASQRRQPALAIDYFTQAFARNSSNYLAHYTYASECLQPGGQWPHSLKDRPRLELEEIRAHLHIAIALMPTFGPAHYLLGRLSLELNEDLAQGEIHLRRAAELEPENPLYPVWLASVQLARADPAAARETLRSLLDCRMPPKLRAQAEAMLEGMGRPGAGP